MRSAALVVVLLVLLAGVPALGASGAGAAATESPSLSAVTHDAASATVATSPSQMQSSLAAQQTAGDWAAETVIVVNLHENGNARWNVTFRYALESSNETAAFRRYGDAFEAGQVDAGLDAAFFRRVAAKSSTVTGREMRIRNVSRSAHIENETGVLTLSFVWTDILSQTETGKLQLRDAFLLPGGGTWLATLEPDQRLVIKTPPGYTVSSSSTQVIPRNKSIIIPGPRSFSGDEPLTIVYQEAEAPVTPPSESDIPWDVLIGALVAAAIIGVLIAAGTVLRRREPGVAEETPPETEPAPGEPPSERPAETPPETEPTAESEATEAAEGEAGEAPEDLSLLSDEERVERLLERHGGRMKQATIVEETGWSDAKVSQLLSSMADEDRIEKLRIGRENLISLPDYEESTDEN